MPLHIRKTIHLTGMTCPQCEAAVSRALLSLDGMKEADVRLRTHTADILFDSMTLGEQQIRLAIEAAGYGIAVPKPSGKALVVNAPGNAAPEDGGVFRARLTSVARTLLVFGLLLVGLLVAGRLPIFGFLPEITPSMGYGMLFVTGLLTSVHCLGMCGGIGLSQCLPRSGNPKGPAAVRNPEGTTAAWKPSLSYNLGRVLSYTIIGGIVGAIGSVFTLPGVARGLFAILAGLFTVVMGLSLLGTFPSLTRFLPRMPASLRKRLPGADGSRGPFFVGLLNGLMPCGPLQAMQLYALGTGSALAGALSMLCFSLGTLPAMFVLGAAGTLFGRRVQRGLMRAGALVVVLLGLLLVQRGLNLGGLPTGNGQTGSVLSMTTSTAAAPGSGNPSDPSGTDAATPQPVGTTDADGFQRVMGEVSRGAYPSVTVKKGIPVRLNLHAASGTITGCNRTVVFPEYGIEQALNPGDNTVEFTPDKTGTIGYTCWMGMVSGSITVVE